MKRTLIAISVACVGTLVAMADEGGSVPAPYETLAFASNNWFEVKASASAPSYVGGSITQGEFKVQGDALAFNCLEEPVVFLTDDVYTQELSTVSLDVTASTVPNGKLALAEDKIAVALYESASGSATNFVACVGGGRFDLVGSAVPYEGDAYRLLIRFDNRIEGKKVAFAWVDAADVEYTLTNATTGMWFSDYTVNFKTNRQMNVGFLGRGVLNNLKGFQLNIVADVIPTTNGTVIINKEDLAAFEADPVVKGIEGGVNAYMRSDASSVYSDEKYRFQKGISVAQAYALGLIKTVDGKVEVVNDGAIEVKAASASLTPDKGLKVNFIGITPNEGTGASFSFKLFGSSGGTDWTDLGIKSTSVDAIYIPTGKLGEYHFFKVVTEVLLKDAPAPQDN